MDERNYTGIQFEKIRKTLDHKYNQTHDELSDCYYAGLPFRGYGVLTKEQFDKLHGLIFLKWEVEFHAENVKRGTIYPADSYRYEKDNVGTIVADKVAAAAAQIEDLKTKDKLELVI